MPQLETDKLTYHYPGSSQPSLKAVSVKISEGEFVAVIGANNSGKSTLCYAFTGVVPQLYRGKMTGRVLINGTDSREKTVSEIAQHVGLVLQVPCNQMSGVRYTVFEEVAFGLENQGIARGEMTRQVEKVLAIMGLEKYSACSPYHLSGGQQQRLALATVLAVDPAILVLDEPTTFLDPQGAKLTFDILRRLQQQGKTVVIAEQKLDLIAEYADRVLAFDKGRLVMDGPPGDVLTSPMIKSIRLDWNRYTQVADLARRQGLWPKGLPLSTSLSGTIDGLLQGRGIHGHSH
ncbi:energy-coupling factor ABC transporter ATP-binding protein [Desulfosediminicola ganghwensis]|uniref:energy-coupling factor ABC transporter ATP-binding protein n=1 Tax=Desulfosediminicola ganghwensis TaxID=2569540 RepID=UPI0010AD89BD|nr:ABC transporter ATP-binding protein [Desulfosediminicola ganghwensis]